MGFTDFPHGITSFGIPLYGSGLGPLSGLGMGKISWVVQTASDSNSWYKYLTQVCGVSVSDIYTLPSLAYAATVTNRGDTILVTPGVYTETAGLAWAKDYTHMVGVGGPNIGGDWTLPGVHIYTATTTVAETIDITGDYCQFHNLTISNYGNNATCVAAVTLDGYGCTFKNVAFQGIMTAGQVAVTTACSLQINQLGHFPIFEDCIIGQNQWGVRTAAGGHLRFSGSTAPAPTNGIFRRCTFLSVSTTATVPMVLLVNDYCIDRSWLFDNCFFSNFRANFGTAGNQVFQDDCGTSHVLVLKNCMSEGYDEWQDDDWYQAIVADMPAVGTGGGLARTPTSITGS